MLDRLDRLVQAFDMAQLATAVYGRLITDQDSALLIFANGGHPPPVVTSPRRCRLPPQPRHLPRPLLAADRPPAPPDLSDALKRIDDDVHGYLTDACLRNAA